MNKKKDQSNNAIMRYLSYGVQMMAAIGLSFWLGYWLDNKTKLDFPLLELLLPIIVLTYMLIQIVREFSKKKK